MRSHLFRALLGLVLFSASAASIAGTAPAATGLGQSWPNSADVSGSNHFHVYTFLRSGIRYVQVNDGAGQVRGAVGYVDGQVIELPIGQDANHWVVIDEAAAGAGEMVYRDEVMTVRAAALPGGAFRLMVESHCKGGPGECSVKGS